MKRGMQEPEGFADFWSIWREHQRKTDGRGKARPAYRQMIEAGADPRDIIDGARWYLRNMTDRDAPYIPLAASWLRSERWVDDSERERAYQARLADTRQEPSTVEPLRRLPDHHFSRRWERGEIKAGGQ